MAPGLQVRGGVLDTGVARSRPVKPSKEPSKPGKRRLNTTKKNASGSMLTPVGVSFILDVQQIFTPRLEFNTLSHPGV